MSTRELARVELALSRVLAVLGVEHQRTVGGSVGQGLKDRGTLLIPDPACTL